MGERTPNWRALLSATIGHNYTTLKYTQSIFTNVKTCAFEMHTRWMKCIQMFNTIPTLAADRSSRNVRIIYL